MGFKKFLQNSGLIKKDEPSDVSSNTAAAAVPVIAFPTIGSGGVPQSGTDYGAYLENVLEKNNLPGLDFREFSKTLNTYDNKPIPEQQKYEYAYAPFEASNVTPAELTSTSQHYLKCLDAEAADFAKDEAEETAVEVTAKKEQAERLIHENEELNRKIQENNQNAQRLNEEAYVSSNRITSEKQAFEYQLTNKRSVIADRVAKINMYLHAKPTS